MDDINEEIKRYYNYNMGDDTSNMNAYMEEDTSNMNAYMGDDTSNMNAYMEEDTSNMNVYMEENIEYDFRQMRGFDTIPENTFPVKVIKKEKKVSFGEDSKPMNQPIPKQQARLVRPIQPKAKEQLTYDDILSKMGMYVVNGQLHLKSGNNGKEKTRQQPQQNVTQRMPQPQQNVTQRMPQPQQNVTQRMPQPQQNIPQNSYIYNKYFKDALVEESNIRTPRTIQEYRDMLVRDAIQRARIRQMKSKKMIMSTANIGISARQGDLNKLFKFSQR
jgi:hypothetical protein